MPIQPLGAVKIRFACLLIAVTFTFAARASTPVANLDISYLPVGSMLSWTCESPEVASFIVERSTDGFAFETISRVAADGLGAEHYNYLDTRRPEAKVYYRITSFDVGGSSAQSALAEAPAVRRPTWALAGGYTVEAEDLFEFEVEASNVSFLACDLLDFVGKPLLHQELLVQPGVNRLTIPVGGLPAGAYRLKISGDDLAESLTFLKTQTDEAFAPLVRGNR